MRTDNGFTELCKKSKNYMEKSNFEFSPLTVYRLRKKKRLSNEEVEDHPITDPLYEFKIKTYFVSLGTIITAINDRFTSKSQDLLKDISLFSTKRLNEVKVSNNSLPIDAFNTFCEIYSKFVQLDDLKKEYISLPNNLHGCTKKVYEMSDGIENTQSDDSDSNDKMDYNNENTNLVSLLDLLKLCHTSGLKEVFPTFYTALHIATTLPVTSASPERTFSKLKIIKIDCVAQLHKADLKT